MRRWRPQVEQLELGGRTLALAEGLRPEPESLLELCAALWEAAAQRRTPQLVCCDKMVDCGLCSDAEETTE